MIKKPMLAASLEDLSLLKYPILCTPKLDGIRCLIVNGKAVTRKFKPVPNNYIRAQIESAAPEGFDGEIIIEDKTFNEISSAIMSEDGEPDFTYVVFDYYSENGYNHRMSNLNTCSDIECIKYLLPVQINNEPELMVYETQCLSDGYEGVMIRSPGSPYKFGRSTVKEGYLLKLKRFYDSEAVVFSLQEKMHNENEAVKDELGHTKRSSHQENQIPANTLGAFCVKEMKTGVEFKIGTGFDSDFANQVWSNQKDYIGKIIKYKAQKVGEKDKPRFPSFLGFRDERDL
jgi:DNA ligase-1